MPQLKSSRESKPWHGQRVGITGVRGSLGQALARGFQAAGAEVIGLTHRQPPPEAIPAIDRWVSWTCGREMDLEAHLLELDVLVLTHIPFSVCRS